jgi:hypothetical protein
VPSTTRRVLLGVACTLVGLSGCLGNPGASESTPTQRPTGTEIDDSCSAADPPTPTDAATESKSYPEKPGELTRESVGSFVEAYERAYQYNTMLAAHPDEIGRRNDLDISVSEVTATVDDGTFTVGVSGQANTGITADSDDPETPTQTPLPMGHWPFATSYTVTARFVRREGTVYECW